MTTKKVEVVRAFCIGGERQEVGNVVEVSPVFAAELIHNGKAIPATDKPAKKGKAKPAAADEVPAESVEPNENERGSE